MLESLKKDVYEANLSLLNHHLVILTWGNVSAYDPETGYIVIKPSGVDYHLLKADDMVVVDFQGRVIEGKMKPSSDTWTHLEIYKHFNGVQAIVHTHSKWATIFAQAKRSIIPYGTTQADYFSHEIPVTRMMNDVEIASNYEKNTGTVIVETFQTKAIDPLECPGVLVNEHGPFTWGKSLKDAVQHAVVLEYVAEMAYHTKQLNHEQNAMQDALLQKHYQRKHGSKAYYGQK